MIIFIAAVLITIVSFAIFNKTKSNNVKNATLILWAIGLVCSIVFACWIICSHVGVNATIEKNRIEYGGEEALVLAKQTLTLNNVEDVTDYTIWSIAQGVQQITASCLEHNAKFLRRASL